MNILLKNGRVIDPAHAFDQVCDLYISQGHIVGLGKAPPQFTEDRILDCAELVVSPGFIDLRGRLREPGCEHKATVDSETLAALAGGVTTLCCPPDTDPPIDTPGLAQWLIQRARTLGRGHIYPVGALTRGLAGQQLADMYALKQAGCVALSNARAPIHDTAILRHALEYAAGLGITVFLTPEDPWLAAHGFVHEGEIATRLGLAGIPETAETVALARDLLLIEQTGVRAHFMGLSAGRSVALIALAKEQGLPVTADVAIHQLHLTEQDIRFFDTNCHVRPPLRTMADQVALRQGLVSGVIDAICSDHEPHEDDAKKVPFQNSGTGIAGLETLLPLTLQLVTAGLLSLPTALARLTVGPAHILGQDVGLAIGQRADICVFDPNETWVANAETLYSRGHNSPFLNHPLRGRVVTTLVDGHIRYERTSTQ